MQFIDLKAQYAALKGEIDTNMQDVLNSAAFIGGKYVKELETQLAAFTGRKHCITCANGTDALQLAFMARGGGGRGVRPRYDLHLLHGACRHVRRGERVLRHHARHLHP